MKEKRWNDAETSAKQAIELAENVQPTDGRLPEAVGLLGSVYAWRADFKNAEETYKRQLTLSEKLYGPKSPMITTPLERLAMIAAQQRDYASAEAFFSRAVDINENSYGQESSAAAAALRGLAGVYMKEQNFAKSESLMLRVVSIYEHNYGEGDLTCPPPWAISAISTINGASQTNPRPAMHASSPRKKNNWGPTVRTSFANLPRKQKPSANSAATTKPPNWSSAPNPSRPPKPIPNYARHSLLISVRGHFMPFPQQQVEWMLANREKIFRYAFISQLLVALALFAVAYFTGKIDAHLLLKGARTEGKIVGFQKRLFYANRNHLSTGTPGRNVFLPIVEFEAPGALVRFEEQKLIPNGEAVGWSVPVLYDPANPSVAMIDRCYWNYIPWAPALIIAALLCLASIKGLFLFLFQRNPEPSPSIQTSGV